MSPSGAFRRPTGPDERTGAWDDPGVAIPQSGSWLADNRLMRLRGRAVMSFRALNRSPSFLGAAGARLPALAVLLAVAGCTSQAPAPAPTAEPVHTGPLDARVLLAGFAAAAKDHRFSAGYTLSQPRLPARTVTVTVATDGSWRLDIPGGALGGQANVTVAGNRDGLFQCNLAAPPVCTRVAPAGGAMPAAVDPRVQHPFVDWLDVLTDRQAPLSVATAAPLRGSRGACFSVEPTAAGLLAPMDAGVYCYDPDGTLTAVRAGFGTLTLATPVSPAPPTALLPGPVGGTAPLPTAAPPPPPPSPSPSPVPTPTPSRTR